MKTFTTLLRLMGEWRYSSTHAFVASAIAGVSVAHPNRFFPGERAPCNRMMFELIDQFLLSSRNLMQFGSHTDTISF